MPKNVIVVGPPRSGTSLTASVFAGQGYYVAEERESEVRGGDDANPFGYWEAAGVIDRNVDVFARAGYPHHNTWLFDRITPEHVDRIRLMEPSENDRRFVEGYNQHAPWMWKDPRLCYTIGYWWPLVDQDTTVVLVVRRDVEAVYRSFRRQEWCGPGAEARDGVRQLIADHIQSALESVERLNIPHLVVEYEQYLITPDAVAKRIGEHCGLPLDGRDLNVRRELDHSTWRGRLGTWARLIASRLPTKHLRRIKALMPNRLIRLLLPEKQYVASDAPPDRRTGG